MAINLVRHFSREKFSVFDSCHKTFVKLFPSTFKKSSASCVTYSKKSLDVNVSHKQVLSALPDKFPRVHSRPKFRKMHNVSCDVLTVEDQRLLRPFIATCRVILLLRDAHWTSERQKKSIFLWLIVKRIQMILTFRFVVFVDLWKVYESLSHWTMTEVSVGPVVDPTSALLKKTVTYSFLRIRSLIQKFHGRWGRLWYSADRSYWKLCLFFMFLLSVFLTHIKYVDAQGVWSSHGTVSVPGSRCCGSGWW